MSHYKGYFGAATIGALGGGIAVALATRAIPTVLTRTMSEMKEKMMAGMAEGGFDPAEMCHQMMAGFGEAQTGEGSQGSRTSPECGATTSAGCGCGATPTAEATPEPETVSARRPAGRAGSSGTREE